MKIKDEKKALEKMIEAADDVIEGNIPKPGDTPELQGGPMFEIDYDQLEKDCNKKAKKLIKNATGFVLTDEFVKENPYLKNKMDIDIISLSGMLYQMELTKIMQKALTEEVRHGAMHPRMFEVFSGLAKTISENNKQLLQTVEAIKTTYLDIKDNARQNSDDIKAIGDGGVMRNEKGIIALGTKDLIKQTKQLKAAQKNNEDIEDVEEIN